VLTLRAIAGTTSFEVPINHMKAKIKAHAVNHTPSVTAPTVVVDLIRDAMRSVGSN
jgi:hypothetical protein